MPRPKLLVLAAVVLAFTLGACSDVTAPRQDLCPISSGSDTCALH
jgi:hypothetical protein